MMKRIGELTCRFWRPRRRPSALWGGGGRGDECRHLARHGWPTACGGSGRLVARSSFYAMTSGHTPSSRRQSVGDRSDSDQALLVAIPTFALGGRGLRTGLGFGSVATSGLPASGCPPERENNLLSPHRCRRRGGNPHDGEIITHAPNLMWGTDGVAR